MALRQLYGAAGLDVLHDLFVGEALVGDVTEGDDLVEHDAVTPDVRLVCEHAGAQTLGSHPADGEQACNR